MDEKIEVIINLLKEMIAKLQSLEETMSRAGLDPTYYQTAVLLSTSFSLPFIKSLEAVRKIYSILSGLVSINPISKAILLSLSTCEPLSISEISRRVREIRGSSSRRIISDRINGLLIKGVIINVGNTHRPKFMLKACTEK